MSANREPAVPFVDPKDFSASDLLRGHNWGARFGQLANGVTYSSEVQSLDGERFLLYAAPHHTQDELRAAAAQLRQIGDVTDIRAVPWTMEKNGCSLELATAKGEPVTLTGNSPGIHRVLESLGHLMQDYSPGRLSLRYLADEAPGMALSAKVDGIDGQVTAITAGTLDGVLKASLAVRAGSRVVETAPVPVEQLFDALRQPGGPSLARDMEFRREPSI
ncbi:hypothetical protein [Geopseudomonas aromaticivorans]